jgi:hypothetical protein
MKADELQVIIDDIGKEPPETTTEGIVNKIYKALNLAQLLMNTRELAKVRREIDIATLIDRHQLREAKVETERFQKDYPEGSTFRTQPKLTFGLLLEAVNLIEQGIY